jgi:hypothetical protein
MVRHLMLGTLLAAGVAMAVPACSGDNGDDCRYSCEQPRASGPYIDVTPNGASIAAIETLAPGGTSDGGGVRGCAVSWSGLAVEIGQTDPVCPAPPVDVGWAVDACAERYLCTPPNGYQLDGGFACDHAWINMNGDRCVVTVISTYGERQTFEVTVIGTSSGYRCRTGMDQCVDIRSLQTDPSQISLTFGNKDGGAQSSDGGLAMD